MAVPGPWTFPTANRVKLFNGGFDLDTDSFKVALFLSTSNLGLGSTTYAALTNEHANANGYTTGGNAIVMTVTGSAPVMIDAPDPAWAASGGSISARYAVIYEVAGDVLCYSLLDSTPADQTATAGNSFPIVIDVAGIISIAFA